MKILYDHQAFTIQRFGGVSKCFCELITNMPAEVEARVAVMESDNVHLREAHLCPMQGRPLLNMRKWKEWLPFRGSGVIYRSLQELGLLPTAEKRNERYAIQMLKEGHYDVFHPTFFDPYFLKYIGKRPWVMTVHDMMPELFPEYFGLRNEQIVFKRKYLGQAAAIIAVSEQTKSDIVRLLRIPSDRITVVYHGGPDRMVVQSASLINAPYFLYVGTREAYKNFPQTLSDFSDFHKRHPEVKLVCTGDMFTKVELAMIERLGISGAVEHIYANGEDMKSLYAHSVAFVYPSLYEGFGMPILEAFAYGCPTLLNYRSCFPEIAADAAIYFDSEPGRSTLGEAMERIYAASTDERQNIVQRGYQRLEGTFSWRKSAEKLAMVYEQVAEKAVE